MEEQWRSSGAEGCCSVFYKAEKYKHKTLLSTVYHLPILLSTIYYLSPIFLSQEMPCHLQSQPENVFISYLHIIVFIDIEL